MASMLWESALRTLERKFTYMHSREIVEGIDLL